jgi:tetratricopeptide (TPR) repeat protein
LALGGGDRIETRQAYGEAIAAQSPDDRFAIEQSIEPSYPALTLDRWIGVLRFAECDPKLVGDALPFLLPLAGAANPAERDDLVRVVVRAWDGYLHIGEPRDLGFALGTLATVLGAWREAVALFEGSLRWYGPTQAALFELARCHRQLGELAAARARLDEALVIDPAYPPAIALAAELAARAAP